MLGSIAREFVASALFLLVYVSAWFVLSLVMQRNDVADVAWGLGPALLSWWLATRAGGGNPVMWLIAALVSVWGVRLAWHIALRDFAPGRTEDPRYAAWRAEWRFFKLRSYAQVFLLQGLFMLLVSAPAVVVAAWPLSGSLPLAVAGILVWILGFAFESIGDHQLSAFLSDPAHRGHVMDRGLWAWSRHPNYFGESLMWWGIAVVALGVPIGWLGLVSPATITLLLVFVSGIPLVEGRHAGEPEWEAYKARTSAFLPLPPKHRQMPQ